MIFKMGKDLQILEAQLPFLKTLLQWEHHLFMALDQEEAPQALVLVQKKVYLIIIISKE